VGIKKLRTARVKSLSCYQPKTKQNNSKDNKSRTALTINCDKSNSKIGKSFIILVGKVRRRQGATGKGTRQIRKDNEGVAARRLILPLPPLEDLFPPSSYRSSSTADVGRVSSK